MSRFHPAGRSDPIVLGPDGATVDMLGAVADGTRAVVLSAAAHDRMADAHARLAAAIGPVYGLTTGVGALDGTPVGPAHNVHHQRSLLRSHAAGVGAPMAEADVRAMCLVRLAALARGHSGVSLPFVDVIVGMLSAGVVPYVPAVGSVGAADLAPLAHVGLVAIGESRARRRGTSTWRAAADVLAEVGLTPAVPTGRDALAWMNGTAQAVARAGLLVLEAERFVDAWLVVAALGAVAAGSRVDAWSEPLDRGKPHPGSRRAATILRGLVPDPPADPRLREPLSTRCAHHVAGAVFEAIERLRAVCEVELTAVVDNPALLPDGTVVNNAANFDGSHVAQALDALVLSVTHAAVGSERRTDRLLDPHANRGLPAFLVHPRATPGSSSGLMIAQYTAAALVAGLRRRCMPVSAGSMPTCAGTEDHVSMAAAAAENAASALDDARHVLAAELLCAAQAVDLRGACVPAPLRPAYEAVRDRVAPWVEDRILAEDLAALTGLVADGIPR